MGYSKILNIDVTTIKHIYLYSRIVCLECWFIRTCVLEYINKKVCVIGIAPGGGGGIGLPGDSYQQAIGNLVSPSDEYEAPGGSGCRVGLRRGFYTALDEGLEAMICWGPSYEQSLYWGNIRSLEVVAWWFVARIDGFRKIALLGISRRVW